MRLRRLEGEFGDRVQLEWRTFLLRPYADSRRTLDEFRTYTRSWMRPAAEPDGGTFQVWTGDAGPPSHSVPPHLVAKAAATLGQYEGDAFNQIVPEESGGPFVETSAGTEFAGGTDESNIEEATREPFPTT